MASGVAALVRHLPAGSPSIFYCIQSLVDKATGLCSTVSSHESDMWKNWEGQLEPCKKMLDLLLRLLALVDIQVSWIVYIGVLSQRVWELFSTCIVFIYRSDFCRLYQV